MAAAERTETGKRRLALRAARPGAPRALPPWPVLVVDDDPQVHDMTRVLLRDMSFEGRGFEPVDAHSAEEARAILAVRDDIPVMLLDVVMESDDAGLQLVRHIRRDRGDARLRIILRTGQPGQAPEREVMLDYDINDYRAKTELTAQRLFTAIVGAIRSWRHIDTIERLNAGLEERVAERTRDLEEARAFAAGLLDILPNPVWYRDRQGLLRLCNQAFRDFFRLGRDTPAEAAAAPLPEGGERALLAGETRRVEFEAEIADGTGQRRAAMVAKAALRSADGPALGVVGVLTDITERKALEDELRRLATTDPLTGAANRRRFMDVANRECERAERYRTPLSLAMLDIDHFKRVNDTWGHGIGDEVLRAVVRAVAGGLREIDLIGRLGGEEFAVLLPETELDGAMAVAERLRRAVAETDVPVPGGAYRVTVSLGVADWSGGGLDALLGRADRALYRAKDAGRDRVEAG
ncbi:diguanylate cyclase [Magnetospirillum sp. UT-4]|uniref:diguanylate cyclase n=1 Tax=Magnetospirillum sp. UT-4 TaxID=2681467 RepID=UPI00137F781F|nr:diguanylate cyclase [Magnetospirillum sp. UT-4]CAA7611878.1 PAS:GGDEF [Magnetospirillum sp. UT-4]